MGSRKIDLPPNYDDLPDDMRVKVMEEACRWSLKERHGLGPDSPLLKSKDKIKDLEK